MNNYRIILKILGIIIIILTLKSCGLYKPTDAKEFPPEPEKRVQKNLEEGRGFQIFSDKNKGGGTFDFASSNPMWRASLDIINFMPLISADYGGGLIITDWYTDGDQKNQSIKISIRFLSNEIRADGLEIIVFTKDCNSQINCKIQESDTKIKEELKIAILKRAAKYKKDLVTNEPKGPKRTLESLNPGG
jgi:hypothetical protein